MTNMIYFVRFYLYTAEKVDPDQTQQTVGSILIQTVLNSDGIPGRNLGKNILKLSAVDKTRKLLKYPINAYPNHSNRFPIHISTLHMCLSMLYFKGSQVAISWLCCNFGSTRP